MKQEKPAKEKPDASVAEITSSLLHDEKAVLTFSTAGEQYGLPVENVVRIIDMVAITRLPSCPDIVVGVLNFHGQVIPVVDMRKRLGRPFRPYGLRTPIIVALLNSRTMGLVVDTVSGTVNLEPDQMSLPSHIFGDDMALQTHHLLGIARQEDGLLLILDPTCFLSLEEETVLSKALSSSEKK